MLSRIMGIFALVSISFPVFGMGWNKALTFTCHMEQVNNYGFCGTGYSFGGGGESLIKDFVDKPQLQKLLDNSCDYKLVREVDALCDDCAEREFFPISVIREGENPILFFSSMEINSKEEIVDHFSVGGISLISAPGGIQLSHYRRTTNLNTSETTIHFFSSPDLWKYGVRALDWSRSA